MASSGYGDFPFRSSWYKSAKLYKYIGFADKDDAESVVVNGLFFGATSSTVTATAAGSSAPVASTATAKIGSSATVGNAVQTCADMATKIATSSALARVAAQAASAVAKIGTALAVGAAGFSGACAAGPVTADVRTTTAAGSSGASGVCATSKIGSSATTGANSGKGVDTASKIGLSTAIGDTGARFASASTKTATAAAYGSTSGQFVSVSTKLGSSASFGRIGVGGFTVAAPYGLAGGYPDPSDVRLGVLYGPTGTEYAGTFYNETAVVSDLIAALQGQASNVNVVEVNGVLVSGTGVAGDEWGPDVGSFSGSYTPVAGGIPSLVTSLLAALNATVVPANVKEVNATTVTGTGAKGSEWGPS